MNGELKHSHFAIFNIHPRKWILLDLGKILAISNTDKAPVSFGFTYDMPAFFVSGNSNLPSDYCINDFIPPGKITDLRVPQITDKGVATLVWTNTADDFNKDSKQGKSQITPKMKNVTRRNIEQ